MTAATRIAETARPCHCDPRTAQRSFADEARRFARVSSIVDAHDLVRHRGVHPCPIARLERLLHSPVFAGVKGQHRDSAAGREALRQRPQQRSRARRTRRSPRCAAPETCGGPTSSCRASPDCGSAAASPARTRRSSGLGRLDGLLLQEPGDERGVRLIGVLLEQAGQRLFAHAREQLRRRIRHAMGSSACRADQAPCS